MSAAFDRMGENLHRSNFTPYRLVNLTLFDLDGTLIPLDTNHAFGSFLVEHDWADRDAWPAKNLEFLHAHDRGELDLDAFIDFSTAAWRHRSPSDAEAMRTSFVRSVIAPALPAKATALIKAHLDAGDLVALVTGTNEFLAEPIGALLGIEHVLAVRLERDEDGRVTGRIHGIPSFGVGKVTRVQEWLGSMSRELTSFDRVTFYGDSVNDIPLLELASEPVVVNASPSLKDVARQRGWRMLDLFA